MIDRWKVTTLVFAGTLVAVVAPKIAAAMTPFQADMGGAQSGLEAAVAQLQAATPDHLGHRAKAIKLCGQAKAEVIAARAAYR
jgi:hypothetical protein